MIIDNVTLDGSLVSIRIENHKIASIGPAGQTLADSDLDGKGARVIPGMIDVHTHGQEGMDTMDADLEPLCLSYARVGTTSLLATTMCMKEDYIQRVTDSPLPEKGAHLLGFHLEGPYLSDAHAGAQDAVNMIDPSAEAFRKFRNVKMVTIAPERTGSMEFIKAVSGSCLVSLGHTGCSYELALEAFDAGASGLTHMYNAMAPFHHRKPGPIGAALMKQAYVQLICDGLHVSQPSVLAAFRLFPGRVVLISDSIRPAGFADGEYSCGGLRVCMKNGQARLADGTIAGSSATLLQCVRQAIAFGVPEKEAIEAATLVPAQMLGVRKGRIAEGYDADLLLVDEQLNLVQTIIG